LSWGFMRLAFAVFWFCGVFQIWFMKYERCVLCNDTV